MHFSNGVRATYNRNLDGSITANNIMFKADGSVDFFVGSLDMLKNEWCIDGIRVEDWEAVNRK